MNYTSYADLFIHIDDYRGAHNVHALVTYGVISGRLPNIRHNYTVIRTNSPPVAPHGECTVNHSRCRHCHNLYLMCRFCTSSFHLVNS